jgi:HEAT repeat protein
MQAGSKTAGVIGIFLMASGLAAARFQNDDVAALLKELKSKNPRTRMAAAEELGHKGSVRAADVKDAVPVLFELLKKEKNAGARRAFILALGKMDPEPQTAVPVFTAALKEKDAGVRVAAATSLARLGPDANEAVPALEEAAKDKDRAVSRAARMALQTIRAKKKS